jgi:hypothetical protein
MQTIDPKLLTAVRRGRSEGRRDVTRIDLDVRQSLRMAGIARDVASTFAMPHNL